jgi:hypothetical protein
MSQGFIVEYRVEEGKAVEGHARGAAHHDVPSSGEVTDELAFLCESLLLNHATLGVYQILLFSLSGSWGPSNARHLILGLMNSVRLNYTLNIKVCDVPERYVAGLLHERSQKMLSVACPLKTTKLASLARVLVLVPYHVERSLLLSEIIDFDSKVSECREPVMVKGIELDCIDLALSCIFILGLASALVFPNVAELHTSIRPKEQLVLAVDKPAE